MSTWNSTKENFAHIWNIVLSPQFDIVEGTGANELKVTPMGARGLVSNETYIGELISDELRFTFTLEAAGLSGGNKQLTFHAATENSVPLTATGPAGSDPNWGAAVEDFDGTWNLAGGGQFEIKNEGQIQCIDVLGLSNLLYQGDFDGSGSPGKLTMTFGLLNDGYVDDDPTKPKKLLFLFPEVLHIPGVPTEGERYEDNESGGGG